MTAHDTAPFADAAARENEAALDALDENLRERELLRRQTVKRELRIAAHDLAEGIRGAVRVSPLAAVFAGMALGVWVARRRRAPRR